MLWELTGEDAPREAGPMPPHVAAETSREAAESVRDHVNRLRGMVLEAFRAAGAAGLTCDEMEVVTGLSHQCGSPRMIECGKAGWIVQARDGDGKPIKRRTRSRRFAFVWVAAEFAGPAEEAGS
jgi:hypothetical protein